MKDKYIGSSFDDFLQEEDLMALAEATALKRISEETLAYIPATCMFWSFSFYF